MTDGELRWRYICLHDLVLPRGMAQVSPVAKQHQLLYIGLRIGSGLVDNGYVGVCEGAGLVGRGYLGLCVESNA